ncbi:MAG: hypothetical protein IJF84_13175 [Thermoguttaceae bacterium]|nr:hypothetical protein [Thermoguttaceae bacterium]
MKKAWHDFGKNMRQSNSITGVANSLFMLGKGGSEAILSLVDPYQTVIKQTIALGVSLYGVTARYAELEKAAFRASRAFKTYGATNDFEKHAKHLKEVVTKNGAGDYAKSMGVLADMRRKAPALTDSDFNFAIDTAKDASAVRGTSYEDSLEHILTLMNQEQVSLQELQEAGIEITTENKNQIEQLNNIANLEQRNAVLKKLWAKSVRGAAEEEVKTIAEVYERLGNMIKNMWTNIGEMLAPLAKAFFKIGQFVMNMVDGFIQPFMKFAAIVGKIFNPLISALDTSERFAKGLGTALAFVATWLAKGIIVQGIMAIVSALSAIFSPIGLLIAGLTFIMSYWKEICEGFKEGIGSENLKVLHNVLKNIWQALKKGTKAIIEWCTQWKVFEKIGAAVKTVFTVIGNMITTIAQAVIGIIDWMMERISDIGEALENVPFLSWYGSYMKGFANTWKMTKAWLTSTPEEEAKNEEKKKKKKEFVDPRLKFDTSFESAASMNQRIQKSILSKSSPQVRMCEYLSSISETVKILKNGQDKQNEMVGQEVKSAAETAKNTKAEPVATLA